MEIFLMRVPLCSPLYARPCRIQHFEECLAILCTKAMPTASNLGPSSNAGGKPEYGSIIAQPRRRLAALSVSLLGDELGL